jgi:hypothetical protein
MNNYSSTYASVIAQLLISIFAILKIDLQYNEDEVTKAIAIIIAIVVAVRALVGRYRAGGLKWSGFRKPYSTLEPNKSYRIEAD